MNTLTQLLNQVNGGDAEASEALLSLVYDELRYIARSRLQRETPGNSIHPTDLVHEAYLKLFAPNRSSNWENRRHFFAAAAETMRRILINQARDKRREKRGGGLQRLDFSKISVAIETPDKTLLEIDEAIQALAEHDAISADLVKLRFFASFSHLEASSALGLTRRQGDRCWAYAKAWLFDFLRKSP